MLSAATVRSKLLHGRMPHSANLLILYLHSPPSLVHCLDWQEARQNQVTSDQVDGCLFFNLHGASHLQSKACLKEVMA
ncbi:hypothetical protein PAHAL_2G205300 [Panicum hallii]|uniref:Uncharacterized protein n=1 Tax=Panicum hallii TaxID=206008 RepID=A0A2S3GXY1_9POAL|nr:hypothetical protein PAHAL_2G205300 [Panicum hallii]